jgi:hypothetical protein
MPINWSAEESDPAKQAIFNARGTANARPTESNRGLSGGRPVPDESGLEKWAAKQRAALDFIPTYWNPHSPHISDTSQDRNFNRQLKQAQSALERQGLQEQHLRSQQLEQSRYNFRKIERLRPILESIGTHIPLHLKLGWIDKESSGDVRADETLTQMGRGRTDYTLDEVGLFQISKAERQEILHLKPADRERILSDRVFAVKQGVLLIQHYEKELKGRFNFTDQSPALWQLTKFAHQLGWPRVRGMLSRMQNDFAQGRAVDPSNATWDQIKTNFLLHSPATKREKLSGDLMMVDFVMMRGQFLEQKGLQSNPPR